MQIHYTGYRIRGFYRVAHSGHVWGMASKHAQHRLAIGAFFDRHDKIAASEAFKVSIRTLYRWRQTLNRHAGNAAALTPESCAPHWRRRPTTTPALSQQIHQLRRHYPNLGKAKLHVLLRDWCAQQRLPRTKRKPYFLLAAYSDKSCTKPTSASANDNIYPWTWDNVKALISGHR